MILNTQIFNQVIETAKAKSEGNAYILRAIDRAVAEIEKSSYWSFDGNTLRVKSTTSGRLYSVDDSHRCEAHQQYAVCKHQVARRLMQRYLEALQVAAAQAAAETKPRLSMLVASSTAPLQPPTLCGEMYAGIDV